MKIGCGILAATAALVSASFEQGTILWDESVNGPFSHDFGNPTALGSLRAGTNSIIGTAEVVPSRSIWFGFPDFFSVTVTNHLTVSAAYLQINQPNVWTWIGDVGFSARLAFVENSHTGALLPHWGINNIGSGSYGIYFDSHDQQVVTSSASYRLDFVAIPEPSMLWLLLGGLGWLGFRSWSSARTKP